MPHNKKPIIGLIVPSLILGGGVPSVARFVKDAILRSGRYDLVLISLASSFRDPCNLCLTKPHTWLRGTSTSQDIWDGLPFIHVGATAGELEYQRYLPRKVLTKAIADCDILQVVCGSAAWANAVCGLGKPVAVQVATRTKIERRLRDANPKNLSDWWRKAMTLITDRLDDRGLSKVDAIQVENPWMFEYTKQLNSKRNVDLRYAPPGIDAKSFHPLPVRSLENDSYILCVGRLSDPRKNINLLLDAYSILPTHIQKKVRLVLAGSSGPTDYFWQRTNEMGLDARINYIACPTRPELIKLYQNALLFALPSDEEGLGVVLLEAMGCGTPVVSTKSGGPDGIITDGKDGFLVALDDIKGLANRMEQLCVNIELNMCMGLQARQTIEKHYSQEITAEAFLDMWDKMLMKKNN